MRKVLFICFIIMVASNAFGQNKYAKYYENLPVAMPTVSAPVIPELAVSLKDFGGVGDGVTMNTKAFKDAINKLNKAGGGHLNVPAGVYLTGAIKLRSNIDLHVERNAVILFSPDKKDFLTIGKDGKPTGKITAAITASGATNISITGEGIIDGNGAWWRGVKHDKMSSVEWKAYKDMGGVEADGGKLWYPYDLKHYDNVADTYQAQEKMRTHMIILSKCKNILMKDVTLKNSPKFHFVPRQCDNLIVDNVKVRCDWNAQNGDAIDITNCKNVLVVNCAIDAGDDGICMKGGQGARGVEQGLSENINIQDNTVFRAHGGFVIGSDVAGGMHNIVVRNNTFSGTDAGLRFKSSVGRGGKTSNIFISNIYMNDIKDAAITFETTYFDNHVGAAQDNFAPEKVEFAPDFGDIHISNVVCRGTKIGVEAHGSQGMVHDITIDNATIFYNEKATDIDETCDIKMTNVKFETFNK